MNKRIEKMVKNYEAGKLTVRRDQLKKAVEENAFDYMIVRGYDEVYNVEPFKAEANTENIADYWFRGANIWCKVENNTLKVTMCYGQSYKELYCSLEEKKEEVKEVVTVEESSVEGVEVVYNEEKNGIEISFANKELATEEIRAELKAVGFRYFAKFRKWIARQNDETIATVNKLFGSDSEVEEIDVTEAVEEMLQEETTIKPFTTEEMEETNKIIETLIESGDTLHKVWINENDNCIYGLITNKYGHTYEQGLYAPSYDLHELQGVYRCLASKIVNTSLPEGMEEIEGTLIEENEELNNDFAIHIEGEGSIEKITTSDILKATENLNARILAGYNEDCGGYSKTFITLTVKEKSYSFRYDLDNKMNLQENILMFMLDEEYKEYKYTIDNIEKFTWIKEEKYKTEHEELFIMLQDLIEENDNKLNIENNPYENAIEKINDNELYEVSASHEWLMKDSRLIKNNYFNGLVVATGKAIREFIMEGKRIDVFNLKAIRNDIKAFTEGIIKCDTGKLISLIPTEQEKELMNIKMLPRLEKELQRVLV